MEYDCGKNNVLFFFLSAVQVTNPFETGGLIYAYDGTPHGGPRNASDCTASRRMTDRNERWFSSAVLNETLDSLA